MTAIEHPLLLPEIPVVWRDQTTLQIGLDPMRARAVEAGPRERRALLDLDGTRSLSRVLDEHAAAGGDPQWLQAAVSELAAAGAIVDGRPGRPNAPVASAPGRPHAPVASAPGQLPPLPLPELARLGPDFAAWSQARPGTAESTLLRRRNARVAVRGSGRVGVAVAALLTSAGIGGVTVSPTTGDIGSVPPRAVGPLGPRAASVGSSARTAARDAIAAVTFGGSQPGSRSQRPSPLPDLVILCPPRVIAPETAVSLSTSRVAHLVALSDGPSARVGPLVIPGRTPCLACLELHRADRDPSWPLVAAQVAGQRGGHRPAVDSVLATVTASVAALHALALLDAPDEPLPPSAGGLLELRLPELAWTRRTWAPHPDCGCQWTPEPLAA